MRVGYGSCWFEEVESHKGCLQRMKSLFIPTGLRLIFSFFKTKSLIHSVHDSPPPLPLPLSSFPVLYSVAYRDLDDPSAPTIQGWMLTSTDSHVLLTVKPSFFAVPADGLPEGVQLRVRAGPDASAAEVGIK